MQLKFLHCFPWKQKMLGNIQIDHRTAELHILIIVHFNLFPFRANRISWIVCRAKVSEKIDQTIFEISPSKNRRSTHSNSEHNKHLFRKNHKKSALVKQQPQRERERGCSRNRTGFINLTLWRKSGSHGSVISWKRRLLQLPNILQNCTYKLIIVRFSFFLFRANIISWIVFQITL
jgi:hypothetical protein